MVVADSVKANIRAVLLSKTDGKGVFVNTFLKDYKSIIGQALMYKNMGYDSLEELIKDIPDVCRLQYAEKEMAYKLFGISKPNTYASSFMKRAEGKNGSVEDSREPNRKKRDKGDKVDLGTSLDEEWVPNKRGLFSVCFPNKGENNLSTREDVIKKFSMFGDVEEVNIISQLTFVRYKDQTEAKTAIRTLGTILGVRRADERSMGRPEMGRPDRREPYQPRASRTPNHQMSSTVSPVYNKTLNNDNDDDWDDDTPSPKETQTQNLRVPKPQVQNHQAPGSTPQTNQLHSPKPHTISPKPHSQTSQTYSPKKTAQPTKDSQKSTVNRFKKQNDKLISPITAPSDTEEAVQLYLGNLPNDIKEDELESFVSCYNVLGVRLKHKDNGKTFAFVDCVNAAEAQKMIEELGQTHFRGRTLMVGLGNQSLKGAGAGIANNNNNMKVPEQNGNMTNIEEQFQKLTMHKGNERITRTVTNTQTQKQSQYSKDYQSFQSDTTSHDDVPPPLESTRISNGYEEDMPALEETQMYERRSQKKQGQSRGPKRGQDQMPPLENTQFSHQGMPELESYEMPNLERNSMPHSERKGMPYSHNNMPDLERNRMPDLERNRMSQSDRNRMPALERNRAHYSDRNRMPDYERDMMPQLESRGMPDLESNQMPSVESNRSDQLQVQSGVQLFIGNFPYGTKEEDLIYLLAQYGITNLVMMNRAVTNRSTYAFATCNDLAHAEMAIEKLDQAGFRGRPLTVTLANPVAAQVPSPGSTSSSSMPLTPLANITCTVEGGSGRQVHVEEADPSHSRQPRQPYGQHSQYNQGHMQQGNTSFRSKNPMIKRDFDPMHVCQKLRDYHAIVVKLRADQRYNQQPGTIMIVNITHVENDKIFFGQMLKDSVVGSNTDIPSLLEISSVLQEAESRSTNIRGMGRCAARYNGEWFRGWCNHVVLRDGQEFCDVLYVDYGNKEQLPKNEVFYTNMQLPIWSVAPIARPFKLIEPHFDMESLIGENLIVEVVEEADSNNNFVTTVIGRFGE